MSYGEEEDSCSRGSYGEDDEKVSSKEKLKEFISTLPRGKCWITKHLYYYQGFWYWDERLSEVISAQDASRYESYDPLISSRALVQNLAPHGLRPLCSLSWTELDIIMIPTPCSQLILMTTYLSWRPMLVRTVQVSTKTFLESVTPINGFKYWIGPANLTAGLSWFRSDHLHRK